MPALVDLDDLVEKEDKEFFAERGSTAAEKEVSDMIKIVHRSGLLDVVKIEAIESDEIEEEVKEEIKEIQVPSLNIDKKKSSYGSKFEDYNPVLISHFYSRTNVYELHYGKSSLQSKAQKIEEEYKTTRETEREKEVKEESGQKMEKSIQRIIFAQLTGNVGSVSIEDREKFKNWRQFNKHMRRMYEGAHYSSSVTKSIL